MKSILSDVWHDLSVLASDVKNLFLHNTMLGTGNAKSPNEPETSTELDYLCQELGFADRWETDKTACGTFRHVSGLLHLGVTETNNHIYFFSLNHYPLALTHPEADKLFKAIEALKAAKAAKAAKAEADSRRKSAAHIKTAVEVLILFNNHNENP